MGKYNGRAELLDASGHVVDTVEVTLESSLAGNRKSREWSGNIDKAAATGPAWKDVARIRLNGGALMYSCLRPQKPHTMPVMCGG